GALGAHLRTRRRAADGARHSRPARRRGDRGRARAARGALWARGGGPDVGPPRVGAAGVQPPPRAVPRIALLCPALLFGSKLQGALLAAGHEPVAAGDEAELLVVDLT